MTGRWITAGLVALALAGCNKKEAAKPPPPATTETTAPTSPATPPPTTSTTTTSTTITTPPTTEAPPPTSGYTAAPPSKYTAAPPAKDSKEAAADEKIVKSKVQIKAERDVLGAWREQRKKISVLRFTKDGWVSLQQGGGKVRNGKWTADQDGAIHVTFAIDGGEAMLTAHPTDATIMAVVPSSKGPQIWPGYGQVIFQRG